MENITQLNDQNEFTRTSEVLGVYYTSLPRENGEPLARITIKDSEDVYETTHAIAKAIELLAFPPETRVPSENE
jgi:hypothetical protein